MLNCDASSRIDQWTYKDQHSLKGGLYTLKETQNHKKKQLAGLVLQTTGVKLWPVDQIWPTVQLHLAHQAIQTHYYRQFIGRCDTAHAPHISTPTMLCWCSARLLPFRAYEKSLLFALFLLFQSQLVWVHVKRFTVKLPVKYQNCPSLKFGRCVDNWCLCAGVCVRLRRRRAGQLAPLLGGEPLRRGLQEDGRPQRRLWDAGHPPAGQGGQDQPAPVSATHCDTHPATDWPTNRL